MLARPFAVIRRQGFVHRPILPMSETVVVDQRRHNRAALRIGGELHVVGRPESAIGIFITRASGSVVEARGSFSRGCSFSFSGSLSPPLTAFVFPGTPAPRGVAPGLVAGHAIRA